MIINFFSHFLESLYSPSIMRLHFTLSLCFIPGRSFSRGYCRRPLTILHSPGRASPALRPGPLLKHVSPLGISYRGCIFPLPSAFAVDLSVSFLRLHFLECNSLKSPSTQAAYTQVLSTLLPPLKLPPRFDLSTSVLRQYPRKSTSTYPPPVFSTSVASTGPLPSPP